MFPFSKTLSLSKCRRIMRHAQKLYFKHGQSLPAKALTKCESLLSQLDEALLARDKVKANEFAPLVEEFSTQYLETESSFKDKALHFIEGLGALALAILAAIVIRQMWFELYEIPTGSMRPTYREQDHLTVSKTQFGLNIPLQSKHLLFNPSLVERTGVVTFSAEGMPISDAETTCFYFLPCTKRLIKRMIALPGDTIYFYGGKLYGIDKDGNPLTLLQDPSTMGALEHIPFMNFEGDVESPNAKEFRFLLNRIPIGKLDIGTFGDMTGYVFNGKEWIKDNPFAQKTPHDTIQTYSDLFGIRNFAMARLLTKEQVKEISDIDIKDIGEGVLYLELRHTPSVNIPKPTIVSNNYTRTALINGFRTFIPLQQAHLDSIMDNMYTARLVFKNGQGQRYTLQMQPCGQYCPKFPGVPDGTYEFYHGKLEKVGFGGTTSKIEKDHPLLERTPENIQRLFNLGIEMNTFYEPKGKQQVYYPNRYAYLRDNELYVLGAPLLKKEDSLLKTFLEKELERENNSSGTRPYVAFKDYGPPPSVEFIRTFGLKIPEKKYYLLGDNHAMSGDSRAFGFVPEDNIQGVPSFILWPFGERWGFPAHNDYPVFVAPRLIVWGIVAAILAIWGMIHCYRARQPIFKKLGTKES